MKAGLHVFCEKPLTHTIAEARELFELSGDLESDHPDGNQGKVANLRRSIELIGRSAWRCF